MASKNIENEIKARSAAFAADLAALIRQSVMDSLQSALGGSPTPRAASAPAPSASKTHGKRGQGAAASGALSGRIADYVAQAPGSRLEQIAKGLGKPSASLKKAVAAMLASGELTKTGQRRGTSYHTGSGKAPAASGAPSTGKRRGRPPGRNAKAKRATRTKTTSRKN